MTYKEIINKNFSALVKSGLGCFVVDESFDDLGDVVYCYKNFELNNKIALCDFGFLYEINNVKFFYLYVDIINVSPPLSIQELVKISKEKNFDKFISFTDYIEIYVFKRNNAIDYKSLKKIMENSVLS